MAKKIFVIDDEPAILLTLRDRLLMEGYEVIIASAGKSVIRTAVKEKPDIIVLDIMLPDVKGYQLCQKLKKNKAVNAKIIVVTSKIDAVDAVQAGQSGADDFVVKTTDYNALIDSIKQFMPKQKEEGV